LAGGGVSFLSWAAMVVIRAKARPQAATRRKRVTRDTLRDVENPGYGMFGRI
jgi:hypothetical protein